MADLEDGPDEGQIAADVPARPVDWLWQERIPKGQLVIVAGRPDMGKGLFVTYLAAELTRRGKRVVVSAHEDDPNVITRPRLEAAGADLDNIWLRRFFVPSQFDALALAVRAYSMDMVILDPFSAHLTGGVSKHTDSIRMVTTPMQRLAEETGCVFVIVEHALKKISAHAHPLDAVAGGSSGLRAAARMGFIFGKDPKDEDRSILCNVKHNIRDRAPAIEFESDIAEIRLKGGETTEAPFLIQKGECAFDARKLLVNEADKKGKKGGRPAEKRAAAAEWLTNHLFAHGPLKAGQVIEDAKQVALNARTVRRAADEQGVVRNPPKGGRNCTWDLDPELRKMMVAHA